MEEYLHSLVHELEVESQVYFLGYRSDVLEIYQIADLYVFPSYQEGLPMALLEAIAEGLPVVCSDIRGSRDLMEADLTAQKDIRWKRCLGGAIIRNADDVDAYVYAVVALMNDKQRLDMDRERNCRVAEKFSLRSVEKRMWDIYTRLESMRI